MTFLLNSSKPFETLPASPPRPPPPLSSCLSSSATRVYKQSRFTICKIPEPKFEEERLKINKKTVISTQTESDLKQEVSDASLNNKEKATVISNNNNNIINDANSQNEKNILKNEATENKPEFLATNEKVLPDTPQSQVETNEVERRISKFIVKKVGTHILYQINNNSFNRQRQIADEDSSSVSPVRGDLDISLGGDAVSVGGGTEDASSIAPEFDEKIKTSANDTSLNLDDKNSVEPSSPLSPIQQQPQQPNEVNLTNADNKKFIYEEKSKNLNQLRN